MPHSLGNLHGPGIKPMSPALAGRFLTTGPPGKSQFNFHLSLGGQLHPESPDHSENASTSQTVFKTRLRTSLVVQWLRLCTSNTEGVDWTPDGGTKIPHAAWRGLSKQADKPGKLSVSVCREASLGPFLQSPQSDLVLVCLQDSADGREPQMRNASSQQMLTGGVAHQWC